MILIATSAMAVVEIDYWSVFTGGDGATMQSMVDAFNGSWNDYLWPRIVLTDVKNQTLTPGLRLLMGQYEQRWAHMIASCLISMLSPFLLYLFAQKYFLQGISVQASVKD